MKTQQPTNPDKLKVALAIHEIFQAPEGSTIALAREIMSLPLSYIIDPDLFRVCVTDTVKLIEARGADGGFYGRLAAKATRQRDEARAALKRIVEIKWGRDGDCGATSIANEVL